MASVDKHGTGWRVRWSYRGERGAQGGFASKKAAQQFARDAEDAIARGAPWPPPEARPAPRWRDVCERWIGWVTPRVRPSTIEGKAGQLDVFARWWAAQPAGKRDPIPSLEDIEAYLEHLAELGRGGGTRRNHGTTLRQVLAWAAKREAWRGLIPEPGRISLPAEAPRTAPRALTLDEMDRVLVAARQLGRWEYRLLQILRATGLRSAQAMHLRWEHVDLEAATLTIPPGLHGSKSKTEWGVGRIVPLQVWLVDELAGWGVREGWLITRTGGRWATGPTAIRPDAREVHEEHLREIYAAAKVEPGRQVTHAWRKGWRTAMAVAGVDRGLVDYLMGRRQSLDDEVYTDWRLMEPTLRRAVETIPPPQLEADGVVPFLNQARGR